MAEVRTHGSGGKAKITELLAKKRASHVEASSMDMMRTSYTDSRAEMYTSLADDAAMSEPKREASMLFSAAESHLEEGNPKECLKVAEDALAKFKALGADGKAGVADTTYLMIAAHRLEAYMTYKEPEAGIKLAKEELEKFKTDSDKKGEAMMLLATAEISADNARLTKRRDAADTISQALTIAKDLGDKKLEAKCLLESAFVQYSFGDGAEKMLADGEAAQKIYEELDDKMGKAKALFILGLCHLKGKDFNKAVQKATTAQGLFSELGKKPLEAGILNTMAQWQLLANNAKKAVPLAEQALAITKTMEKGARAEAVASFTVCEAQIEAKNAKGALKVAKDALDKFTEGNQKKEQAIMQEALTAAHLASEAPEKAVKTIDLAKTLAEELADKRYEAKIMVEAAAVHLQAKEKDECAEALDKAIDMAQDENDLQTVAYAQRELANFYMWDKKDYKEAIKMANNAIDTAQQDEDKVMEGMAMMMVAFGYNFQDDNAKALNTCNDAQELYQEAGYPEGEAMALRMIAELKAFDGKFEAALEAAEERLSIFRELKDTKGEISALVQMADIHLKNKDFEEAEKVCKEALTLAQKGDDADLETEIHLKIAQIYMEQGEDAPEKSAKQFYSKASKAAADAVSASGKASEKVSKANSLYMKAQTLVMEDKLTDAQKTASEAETLFRNVPADQGQAACLHLIGTLCMANGQVDKALDTLDKALNLSQNANDAELEYQIALSTYNIQRQVAPAMPMMMDPAMMAQMQAMMPAGGGGDMGAMAAAGGDAGGGESVAAKPKGLDPGFVRKQLMTFVKDVMASDDELELDSPFMEAGMDSLSSVSLMSMVAKEFQMALSPSLVFDFPTVRALEDHLVEESKNM